MFDIAKLNEAFRTFGERAKQQDDASTYLNKAEFDPIYNFYREKIISYCYRIMGNPEEAEQAAHDAFLKMWERKWASLPDKKLVYLLAHQACCNILRKRRHVEIQYLDDAGDVLVSDMPAPEEEALWTERKSELLQAISRLPVAYRNVILLQYSDLSTKEIARTLNISERTVRNYRYLAYIVLRKWLDIGG